MVRAARSVGAGGTPELSHHHHGGVRPTLFAFLPEDYDPLGYLAQESIEAPPGHPLVGVRVPAPELDRGHVRPARLLDEAGGGAHHGCDPALAATTAHFRRHLAIRGDLAHLKAGLEPIVQSPVGPIEHVKAFQVSVIQHAQLHW